MTAKILASLAALFFSIASAHAHVIYNWEGQCDTGCTGTAHATLVLTDDVTPAPLNIGWLSGLDHMISWHFEDNVSSFTFAPHFGPSDYLALGALPDGIDELCVNHCGTHFFSFPSDGSWVVSYNHPSSAGNFHFATGTGGDFTLQQIPEPSTLALMALALAGFGVGRRSRLTDSAHREVSVIPAR